MSKRMKNEPVVEDLEIKQEAPPVLTHTSFGIFKDTKTGKWELVRIKYNPITKLAGDVQIVPSDESNKDSAIYRYKIASANEVLN